VLGDHGDVPGGGELAQRERGEQADRSRTADEDRVAAPHLRPQRGVDGARDRLDQQRLLVAEPVGTA
jgi:hypothetical protein